MKIGSRVLALLILTIAFHSVSATSVIPPTFEELVREAHTVFVGEVREVRVDDVSDQNIFTSVTFQVISVLKGTAETRAVLRFMGGIKGSEEVRVEGVPKFSVADRAVLFVGETKSAVSPLVGLMHGRFPIVRAADGQDYVTQYDGTSFDSVAHVGSKTVRVSPNVVRPMRLIDFERSVIAEAAAGRRQP